jgi:molybdopterin molybdotransferase
MIKVEEAQKIILENISSIGSEKVSILESLRRSIAQDYYSKDDIPPFDNSAMDGFAVSSSCIAGTSREKPALLDIVEDLPAGDVTQREIKKGEAVRIMTGAPVPRGADAVIMVEDTQREQRAKSKEQRVKIFKEVEPGENIRRRGEDIKKGDLVLKKGEIVGAAQLGILANLGVESVEVAKSPRVGILATGNELLEVEENLTPGKIRNSNTYSLFGQVKNAGGIPYHLGIVKDNKLEIQRKIEQGLENDMLLISGGVSVGDYDYVKEVMTDLNGRIEFWKVAMRPGKPLVFAVINGKPVFGLPGNPVSSMVSFEVFVRPAILNMLGQNIDSRKEVEAVLDEEISKKKGFRYFLRAQTRYKDGAYLTHTTGPQGSGILKSMLLANSLIILTEEVGFIKKGAKVTVRFLD